MNMRKPRSRAGLLGWSASIAVAAGPDEVVALAALGLDQAGIDRRGEARIVQLDGEVFALRLAGGLFPGCTKIRCSREDAEVGAALAVTLRGDELHGLDVQAQGLDRAGEAVLGLGEGADGCHCRVPFPIGPRQSRPRWWSFDRGRSDRTRRAQRQRLTAADGFFASRCKARHARRKKVGGGCCGKTIEAKPVFGQTKSIRGREVDGADGNYLEHER